MAITTPAPDAITPEEQEKFDKLLAAAGDEYNNARIALMRVKHDGVDRAAVVVISTQPDSDEYFVDPVALLIDDALFTALTPPEGGELI